MAKLLLIKDRTKRDINNLGDIVGIFEDTHNFTEAEYNAFEIVDIKGTRIEVETKIQALVPEEKEVYEDKDGKIYDYSEEVKTDDIVRRFRVWNDNGEWKEIVKPAKYKFSLNQLTTEEKEALSSEVAETVDATIAKILPAIKLTAENIAEASIVTVATKIAEPIE